MNRPNFFIIGAPKCGTTALYSYLIQHPNIFMPKIKEPHFLSKEFINQWGDSIQNEQDYLKLFEDANDQQNRVGEASIWYLYSNDAIQAIVNKFPDAKIIVMLRRPDDMIYSLHSQKLFSLDEEEKDFEKAWKLNNSRKKGENIPTKCRTPKTLYYDEVAKFATQLKHVDKYIDKSNRHVILHDEFIKDIKSHYESVLEFLELPKIVPKEFGKVNENKSHKNSFLARLTGNRSLNKIGEILNKRLPFKLGLLSSIKSKNTDHTKRKKLSKHMRKQIIDHYSEEIDELGKFISRDLSHWKKYD